MARAALKGEATLAELAKRCDMHAKQISQGKEVAREILTAPMGDQRRRGPLPLSFSQDSCFLAPKFLLSKSPSLEKCLESFDFRDACRRNDGAAR